MEIDLNKVPDAKTCHEEEIGGAAPFWEPAPVANRVRSHLPACFSITVILTLGIVGLVNFLGNAQGIFPSPICPARTDRATMARQLEESCREGRGPKVIILGSSRSAGIYPKYIEAITHKRAFNGSVVSGTIVDSLATFRYAQRLGVKVDLLLLEVEEGYPSWCGEVGEFQLQLLGNEGLFAEVPAPEKRQIIVRVFPAINVRSTLESCGNLGHEFLRSCLAVRPGKALDGIVQGENLSAGKTSNFERNIHFQFKKNLRQWKTRRLRDARWLGYFEELLALAMADKVQVRVFFPPLHPRWEEAVYGTSRAKQDLSELLNRIRALCAKYECHCKDFSDLRSFGGKSSEFVDGTHQSWTQSSSNDKCPVRR